MQTIRRLKGDRTHWAKSVDENGVVTAWIFGADSEADAAIFDDAATVRVREYYAPRPDAGRLEFLNEAGDVLHSQRIETT